MKNKVKMTFAEGRKVVDPEIALKFAEAVTGKKPTAEEIAYATTRLEELALELRSQASKLSDD